jgi:hypothetical protein
MRHQQGMNGTRLTYSVICLIRENSLREVCNLQMQITNDRRGRVNVVGNPIETSFREA